VVNRREFLAGTLSTTLLGRHGLPLVQTPKASAVSSRGPSLRGDLAVVNADIITLDPQRPSASALLVQNGRITMVGDTREVRARAAKVPEFDAQGRVVVPGFVDNHCHVEDSCIVGDAQPSLRGIPSIADMVAKVRAVAAGVPRGEWVLMQAVASDFPGNVTERRWLNRQDLDQATEDHPVMVLLGIHASIMNTRAWKETGYWEAGQEAHVKWKGDRTPRRGSVIHRDADGHPTGLATEVWDFRPGYTVEQYKASMRRHFRDWFLAKGLTTIVKLQDTAPNEFVALQELQAEGGLPVRLRVSGGAAPPGESVTLDQALRMWTLWPARNNGEDHEKGSIEVGKVGDLAVLSADPRGRSASEVHAITTHATIVGGTVVYEAS
jgi:predicted amidohydrolase YtcJ